MEFSCVPAWMADSGIRKPSESAPAGLPPPPQIKERLHLSDRCLTDRYFLITAMGYSALATPGASAPIIPCAFFLMAMTFSGPIVAVCYQIGGASSRS